MFQIVFIDRCGNPDILIPTYINEPDMDDIFGIMWGRSHYL